VGICRQIPINYSKKDDRIGIENWQKSWTLYRKKNIWNKKPYLWKERM
jgi:hypothetical protein